MDQNSSHPEPLHRLSFPIVSALVGVALGASLGVALAQERISGHLDSECSGYCAANGYEPEFCNRVCWVPDPTIAARAVPIDWNCMTTCLERGVQYEDCRLSCKR